MNRNRKRIACLLVMLMAALLPAVAFAAVSVSISPTTAQVQPGGQVQFLATVSGTTNSVVNWSLSGPFCSGNVCGHIGPTGVYTAPLTAPHPNVVTVTATSLADLSKSAQAAVIVGLSIWVFNVHIEGSLLAVAGLVLLGALTFVAIGYLVASLARTVESANGITTAVNFPMMFLSGIFFPLALLPAFLTPVVRALPLTYLADALRQVAVGSVPEFPMMVDLAVLAGWAVVCALLSARFFKWE